MKQLYINYQRSVQPEAVSETTITHHQPVEKTNHYVNNYLQNITRSEGSAGTQPVKEQKPYNSGMKSIGPAKQQSPPSGISAFTSPSRKFVSSSPSYYPNSVISSGASSPNGSCQSTAFSRVTTDRSTANDSLIFSSPGNSNFTPHKYVLDESFLAVTPGAYSSSSSSIFEQSVSRSKKVSFSSESASNSLSTSSIPERLVGTKTDLRNQSLSTSPTKLPFLPKQHLDQNRFTQRSKAINQPDRVKIVEISSRDLPSQKTIEENECEMQEHLDSKESLNRRKTSRRINRLQATIDAKVNAKVSAKVGTGTTTVCTTDTPSTLTTESPTSPSTPDVATDNKVMLVWPTFKSSPDRKKGQKQLSNPTTPEKQPSELDYHEPREVPSPLSQQSLISPELKQELRLKHSTQLTATFQKESRKSTKDMPMNSNSSDTTKQIDNVSSQNRKTTSAEYVQTTNRSNTSTNPQQNKVPTIRNTSPSFLPDPPGRSDPPGRAIGSKRSRDTTSPDNNSRSNHESTRGRMSSLLPDPPSCETSHSTNIFPSAIALSSVGTETAAISENSKERMNDGEPSESFEEDVKEIIASSSLSLFPTTDVSSATSPSPIIVPSNGNETPKASNHTLVSIEEMSQNNREKKVKRKKDKSSPTRSHESYASSDSHKSDSEPSATDSFKVIANVWNPNDTIDEELSQALSRNPSASFSSSDSRRSQSSHIKPPSREPITHVKKSNMKSTAALSDIVSGSEWSSSEAVEAVSASMTRAISTLKAMVVASPYLSRKSYSSANSIATGVGSSDVTACITNTKRLRKKHFVRDEKVPDAVDTSTESIDGTGTEHNGGSVLSSSIQSSGLASSCTGPELDMKELVKEIRPNGGYNFIQEKYHPLQIRHVENEKLGNEEKKDDDMMYTLRTTFEAQSNDDINRTQSSSNMSLDSMGKPKPASLANVLSPSSRIHKPVASFIQTSFVQRTVPIFPLHISHSSNVLSKEKSLNVQNTVKFIQPIKNSTTAEQRTLGTNAVRKDNVSKASVAVTPMMRMRHPEAISTNLEESIDSKLDRMNLQTDSRDIERDYKASKQRKWKEKLKMIEKEREQEKCALNGNDGDSTVPESSRGSSSRKLHTLKRDKSSSRKYKSRSTKQRRKSRKPLESEDMSDLVSVVPAKDTMKFPICQSAMTAMFERFNFARCGGGLDSVREHLFYGHDDDDEEEEDEDDDDSEDAEKKECDEEGEEDQSLDESHETETIDESRGTLSTRQLSTDNESESFSRSTKESRVAAGEIIQTNTTSSSSFHKSETIDSTRQATRALTLTEKQPRKQKPAIGIRDKNFIRVFINEITNKGIPLFLHKQNKRQSLTQPTKVTAFIKMGSQGDNDKNKSFSVPSLVWMASDDVELGQANLFEVRSLEKANPLHLENYPLAMPGHSLFLRMNRGMDYVFETNDENSTIRFVHGMRWVIARLSFNLIIGNLSVSCELLDVYRSIDNNNNDLDNNDEDTGKFPRTLKEETQWSKAMNDATNHLIDFATIQVLAGTHEGDALD